MVCTGVHDELCFAFLLLSSGEQEEEALEKVSEEALEKVSEEALEKVSGEISKEALEKISEERSCKTGIAENAVRKNVRHGFTAPFPFSDSHRSFSEKELTENRVLCYFLNVLNMLM